MKNLITNFLAARQAAGLPDEFLRQFRAAVADGQLTDEELAWLAQHQDEMDPDATWHRSAPDLFATAVDALLERGEGALSPEAAAQLDGSGKPCRFTRPSSKSRSLASKLAAKTTTSGCQPPCALPKPSASARNCWSAWLPAPPIPSLSPMSCWPRGSELSGGYRAPYWSTASLVVGADPEWPV